MPIQGILEEFLEMSTSTIEKLMEMFLRSENIAFEREFIAVPGRKFRWDFAFPEHRLLVEIQGGTWLGRRGAHSSGAGLQRDYDKNNLAVINGWSVMYFSASDVRSGKALQSILEFLEQKKP